MLCIQPNYVPILNVYSSIFIKVTLTMILKFEADWSILYDYGIEFILGEYFSGMLLNFSKVLSNIFKDDIYPLIAEVCDWEH